MILASTFLNQSRLYSFLAVCVSGEWLCHQIRFIRWDDFEKKGSLHHHLHLNVARRRVKKTPRKKESRETKPTREASERTPTCMP